MINIMVLLDCVMDILSHVIKAQGGEWDNIIIHPFKIGKDLPWTYTALTRAKKEVLTYQTCR